MKRSLLPAARFVLLAACLPAPSVAAGWEAARFEPPAKTATATSGEGKQITYTIYGNLMVRESDTNAPDPEDATLVPLAHGAAPACTAAPGPGAHILATAGQRFLGRTGGFLVFELASTNGTVPFAVLDAGTGRTLIQDTIAEAGIDSFAVADGTLQLGFQRGVQGVCSIPKHWAACWARIARDGPLPSAVAALPAPMKACAESYRAGKAPKDTPSIVSFPVRLTGTAPPTVAADGPVRCVPTP
ncbi:hypothetical protein [Methylobacterium sp. J-090]|uniref:hypothetical protein n=1 Tax=Methylobacterium sp. J-090 TaxID=2836666 RepID=UPI001FBB1248|nr:hypothetical protein [Methylobacterium sp. J-090]MCJ2081814.1 hypothetical protein [Methylobacterium sp. J-090]